MTRLFTRHNHVPLVILLLNLVASASGQDKKELSWYEKSFYLLHLDHHTRKDQPVGKDADFNETLRILRLSNPDVIQIHAKGSPGYTTYPSKVGNVPDHLYRDVMRVWKDLSVKMHIPFSAYYNLGRDVYLMEHRPEFNRVQADGALYPFKLCYNSAVDEAYLFPMIREIMDQYHPDGFWFDGFIWTVNSCFCNKCREDFRKATGREAPTGPESPDWESFKEMQRDITRNLIKKTCDFVHGIDPKCLVCINYAYSFLQPEKPYEGIAYLSGDVGGDITFLSVLSKLYDTQGKPFDLMTPIGRRKAEDYQEQEIAEIIANGGRFFAWDNPTSGSGLVRQRHEFLGRIAKWLRERQEVTLNSRRIADISLLFIAAAHYRNYSGLPEAFVKDNIEVFSASECLTQKHLLHDIVADWKVNEGQVNTKVIVLENPSVVPEKTVLALEAFVKTGGKLFITGMAPLTGGERMKQMAGISKLSASMDNEFTFGDIEKPVRCYSMEPAGQARVLINGKNSRNIETPILISTSCGKGEVFYAPFPFYTLTSDTVSPLSGRLVDAVHQYVFPEDERSMKTNAPPDVEIVLRAKDSRKMVHLVNRAIGEESNAGTGGLIHEHRYNYTNTRFPARGDFHVVLKNAARPKSVYAEPGRIRVKWEYKNGQVSVDVPRFNVHQVIVVKNGE
jgi:hypothetical protein